MLRMPQGEDDKHQSVSGVDSESEASPSHPIAGESHGKSLHSEVVQYYHYCCLRTSVAPAFSISLRDGQVNVPPTATPGPSSTPTVTTRTRTRTQTRRRPPMSQQKAQAALNRKYSFLNSLIILIFLLTFFFLEATNVKSGPLFSPTHAPTESSSGAVASGRNVKVDDRLQTILPPPPPMH